MFVHPRRGRFVAEAVARVIGTEPAPCALLSLVEMSAHYPDQRDWKREVLLHSHPAYLGEWELVRRWISDLRRAETPRNYYELHRSLLARALACQQFQDQSRKRSAVTSHSVV